MNYVLYTLAVITILFFVGRLWRYLQIAHKVAKVCGAVCERFLIILIWISAGFVAGLVVFRPEILSAAMGLKTGTNPFYFAHGVGVILGGVLAYWGIDYNRNGMSRYEGLEIRDTYHH